MTTSNPSRARAPGRCIRLHVNSELKGHDPVNTLGVFLIPDGVKGWAEKTKVEFGFEVRAGTTLERRSGRWPWYRSEWSGARGWTNIMSLEECVAASSLSDKLVVKAWVTASRYQGGHKRLRLV